MSEQDNSPETNTNSPKPPSTPGKRFSLSKIIDSIILFAFGIVFITSLFSKDKNAENKALPTENTEENKEAYKEAEQQQKNKEKRTESTSSNPERMSKSRGLPSNANRKIKKKMHKKIFNYIYKAIKAIPLRLYIKVLAPFVVFFVFFIITEHRTNLLNGISSAFKYLYSENIPLGISISAAIIVALSLIFGKLLVTQLQKRISSLTNKYFISTLAVLALLGGATALIIPSYTNLFREPGYTSAQQDSAKETPEKVQETPASTPSPTGNKSAEVEQKSTSDLRLHFLYITGGIIAILGLIETNRKNSQDHIRQVHAARRDRYIEAVDKLSSKQAPVRLGGVYALVGLIDEWLDDENIDEETRIKEGQIIVNNLCSYIRSPFTLAAKAKDFESNMPPNSYNKKTYTEDYMKFHEEKDVRRTILTEIVNRIKTSGASHELKKYSQESEASSQKWKTFTFDFSKAPIFYELETSTYETLKLEGVVFYIRPDFTGTIFNSSVSFQSCRFTRGACFRLTRFMGITDFSFTHFEEEADFSMSQFSIYAIFSSSYFRTASDFSAAKFNGYVSFIGARFKAKADFSAATFKHTASFVHARFKKARFMMTKFESDVNFESAYFKKNTTFYLSTIIGNANFQEVHFRKSLTIFQAEFRGNIDFSNAVFDNKAPYFSIGLNTPKVCTFFSYLVDPKNYIFTVSPQSRFSIATEKITVADGRTFTIPVECMLFDPGPLPAQQPIEPAG